jgi:hypothetical protein
MDTKQASNDIKIDCRGVLATVSMYKQIYVKDSIAVLDMHGDAGAAISSPSLPYLWSLKHCLGRADRSMYTKQPSNDITIDCRGVLPTVSMYKQIYVMDSIAVLAVHEDTIKNTNCHAFFNNSDIRVS